MSFSKQAGQCAAYLLLFFLTAAASQKINAQTVTPPDPAEQSSAAQTASEVELPTAKEPEPVADASRDEKLTAALKSTVWTGSFTVDGKKQKLHEESYEIDRAMPTGNDDYWVITATIKYGERNISLPVPIQVKWAGDTPVLTCDELFLPPLGTFDARVLIHEGHYAGTWKHGDKGGHLFGVIQKKPAETQTE